MNEACRFPMSIRRGKPFGAAIRFVTLDATRRMLVLEALAALTTAATAIRFLPFQRAVALGSRPFRRAKRASVADIRWSIDATAARLPFRTVCFQKGLAMQVMLRRRGHDAQLHYGIRFTDERVLQGHVWVEADGAMVIGEEDAPGFERVATYPG